MVINFNCKINFNTIDLTIIIINYSAMELYITMVNNTTINHVLLINYYLIAIFYYFNYYSNFLIGFYYFN